MPSPLVDYKLHCFRSDNGYCLQCIIHGPGVGLLFAVVARRLKGSAGYVFLITFWIAFEFLHYNWELTWPWLTLGNGFAAKPQWNQWYEYTGVFGGSLWILVSNIALYSSAEKNHGRKKVFKTCVFFTTYFSGYHFFALYFFSCKI
jgi:apolipoprotein N-acyltransferase